MSDYNSFKSRWMGRQCNPDNSYGFQCVDLIIQYAREELHTGASMYGNAIDFWTRTPQGLADTCNKLQTTDCQQGDIVVLRTAGRNDFAGDGHIGICDHQDALNVWLLEQNAVGSGTGTGRDAIGIYRAIPKSRIAGVLRPRPVAPPPPPPQAPLWTVSPIAPRLLKVNAGSRKWNLGHSNFTDVANNPITTADGNTVFTAHGILRHREIPQYNYFVEDLNTPHGWNALDCVDYVTPAPPPPPPAPYIPPAPPNKGTPVEKYTLVTEVMAFDTPSGAVNHNGLAKTLDAGEYIVIGKKDNAYNLTHDNMKDLHQWVNTKDNVVPVPEPPKPVEPQPVIVTPALPDNVKDIIIKAAENIPKQEDDMAQWKISTPIKVDAAGRWRAVKYRSTNEMPIQIRSLDGKVPSEITLPAHKELMIVSTFPGPDGQPGEKRYARDEVLTSSHRFYALPFDILEKVIPPAVQQRMDRDGDGDVDINDYIDYIGGFLRPGIDVVARTVKTISTSSSKPRKFLDGVITASKKDRVKK